MNLTATELSVLSIAGRSESQNIIAVGTKWLGREKLAAETVKLCGGDCLDAQVARVTVSKLQALNFLNKDAWGRYSLTKAGQDALKTELPKLQNLVSILESAQTHLL